MAVASKRPPGRKNTPKKVTKIVFTDGVLVPRGKELLTAWRLVFFGGLAALVWLLVRYPDPYWVILKYVGGGFAITFEVTVLSIIFAVLVGLLIGLMQLSHHRGLRLLASVYVELIRGIPLLVQLLYVYYAMGAVLKLSPIAAAVVAIAVCYGAYIAEIFRAGFQSIPKGQTEAALALGLSRGQMVFHVVLPQVVRTILPALGNEFIVLLKDSSLVSVLAVSDLLRRTREFAAETFQYFEALSVAALLYLLTSLLFSRLLGLMEKKMAKTLPDDSS